MSLIFGTFSIFVARQNYCPIPIPKNRLFDPRIRSKRARTCLKCNASTKEPARTLSLARLFGHCCASGVYEGIIPVFICLCPSFLPPSLPPFRLSSLSSSPLVPGLNRLRIRFPFLPGTKVHSRLYNRVAPLEGFHPSLPGFYSQGEVPSAPTAKRERDIRSIRGEGETIT